MRGRCLKSISKNAGAINPCQPVIDVIQSMFPHLERNHWTFSAFLLHPSITAQNFTCRMQKPHQIVMPQMPHPPVPLTKV